MFVVKKWPNHILLVQAGHLGFFGQVWGPTPFYCRKIIFCPAWAPDATVLHHAPICTTTIILAIHLSARVGDHMMKFWAHNHMTVTIATT